LQPAQTIRLIKNVKSFLTQKNNHHDIDLEGLKMAVIREGNKAVLLVIDTQVGVMQNAWDAPRIIKNIGITVEKARGLGVPVIWIKQTDDELVDGSPDWQIVPDLSPAEGEIQIRKQFNSSFEQTTLEETLAGLGASHIVLAGAATNWCIRATAYAALDRGYDLTMIKDAHTTETLELENNIRIEAENIIRELNNAITWLDYPGRINGVASAGDVDFAVSNEVQ
jgi:nicotinamidase-related amidase